jgi:hypothetical protein
MGRQLSDAPQQGSASQQAPRSCKTRSSGATEGSLPSDRIQALEPASKPVWPSAV